MNKELLRMQMLSGIITESEYKAKLEEAGEAQAVAAAEKIEDEVETSPSIEAAINKLSDEEKAELTSALAKLGVTADSSVQSAAAKIAPKIEDIITEADEDLKKKVAKIASGLGVMLSVQNFIPIISLALGRAISPDAALLTGVGLTLGVGGALIGLAKALGGEKVTESMNMDARAAAEEAKKLLKNPKDLEKAEAVLESLSENDGEVDNEQEKTKLQTTLRVLGYGALAGLLSTVPALALAGASLKTILLAAAAGKLSGAGIASMITKLSLSNESLNENFVGMGMVGNIFDREKTDYEIAFEHFTKGTSLNEKAKLEESLWDRIKNAPKAWLAKIKGDFPAIMVKALEDSGFIIGKPFYFYEIDNDRSKPSKERDWVLHKAEIKSVNYNTGDNDIIVQVSRDGGKTWEVDEVESLKSKLDLQSDLSKLQTMDKEQLQAWYEKQVAANKKTLERGDVSYNLKDLKKPN